MVEKLKKYPSVRATIMDDGWSAPPASGETVEVTAAEPTPEFEAPVGPHAGVVDVPIVKAVSQPAVPVLLPRPLVAPAAQRPASSREVSEVPTLGQALGRPVRLFGLTLSLWMVLGVVLLGVAGSSFFFAKASTGRKSTAQGTPAEDVSLAAPTSALQEIPTVARPEPEPLPDASNWQRLAAKPKRELSAEEALELTAAGRAEALKSAQQLALKFTQEPGLVNVAGPLKQFKEFATNERTSDVTLRAMAGLPGEIAADLLYDVWTSSADRSSVTSLAQLLVYSKDVLPKASQALRVALDLRDSETCEQNRALLPRAIEFGDRRSLHLLAFLQRNYGCGLKRKDDCYACLRHGSELEKAIRAVRGRAAPDL